MHQWSKLAPAGVIDTGSFAKEVPYTTVFCLALKDPTSTAHTVATTHVKDILIACS